MSLGDAIVGAVADLISIAINVAGKKLGWSEIKTKQIENFLGWFILLFFVALICYVTFKYS